ncbi:MAG TPA: acetyl-CoA synthase subunit gamma [Desulfotomaculum sp.]|nr:MAG: CO dehydrogenase/acetyl-CoA synthase gamma subunit (Corrinoid Fe-S protein) [Desulfotomaculum sp. 46_80]HAG11070.1 acetyl-CoA synthase subunit gamma [Desulfotomaculum sp.]HBY03616.1 acetyl-CoA synthase subunit gamma [Desulfotomaculum sp.]
MGSWKVRWGINRLNYKVPPGLYGIGDPVEDSPVLVTANYKMTFDRLRKELSGVNAWVLVINTRGINVWCSAGKGTFSATEIARMIAMTNLSWIVSHRTLILPQLSAVGVAAHRLLKMSGFRVVYGPVRACDIPDFLGAGMKASPQMRRVNFGFADRLVLIPMELSRIIIPVVAVYLIIFIINLLKIWSVSFLATLPYFGAIITGCVLTPALLPWIPGRSFAWKGWLLGLLWSIAVVLYSFPAMPYAWNRTLVYLFILPALSSYLAVNFTGASTFTSLSGVQRELRVALPAAIFSAGLGVVLLVLNQFVL